MNPNEVITPQNNLPPVVPQKKLHLFISKINKYKNTILIVAIIIVSAACIGIVVSDNMEFAKKTASVDQKVTKDSAVAVRPQADTRAEDNGVRVDDPDNPGEYIIYHYDGTLESSADPESDTYHGDPSAPDYEDPGMTLDDAVKKAQENPGTKQCGTSGGATETCIVADKNGKTYSETAYQQAYPTAAPEPEKKQETKPVEKAPVYDAPDKPESKKMTEEEANQAIYKPRTGPDPMTEEEANRKIYAPRTEPDPVTNQDTNKNVGCTTGYLVENCIAPEIKKDVTNTGEQLIKGLKAANPLEWPKAINNITRLSGLSAEQQPPQNTDETRVSVTAYTNGVGTNTALGQNPNPVRPQTLEFQILNSDDQVIKSGQFNILATASSNRSNNLAFDSLLSLGNELQPGTYKTRIRLDNTLWRSVDAKYTPGTATIIPPVELVVGDIDNDNFINLLDYNALLSCYGNGATNCANAARADLNLDGKVNEIDLNTLYSGFKTRQGD